MGEKRERNIIMESNVREKKREIFLFLFFLKIKNQIIKEVVNIVLKLKEMIDWFYKALSFYRNRRKLKRGKYI